MLELAPVWQAQTQQRNYRALLEAMSRPGSVQTLQGVDQTHCAAVATLATLLDAEVTLSDPLQLLDEEVWPLLQSLDRAPEQADYILYAADRLPDFEPKMGTLTSPEYSATLVLVVDSLEGGEQNLLLRGPGIRDIRQLAPQGLHPQWMSRRGEWVSAFPLGVDLILADAQRVVALPRTTRIEVQ